MKNNIEHKIFQVIEEKLSTAIKNENFDELTFEESFSIKQEEQKLRRNIFKKEFYNYLRNKGEYRF